MKLGIKSVKIHIVGIFERKTRKLGRYHIQNDGTCKDGLASLDKLMLTTKYFIWTMGKGLYKSLEELTCYWYIVGQNPREQEIQRDKPVTWETH